MGRSVTGTQTNSARLTDEAACDAKVLLDAEAAAALLDPPDGQSVAEALGSRLRLRGDDRSCNAYGPAVARQGKAALAGALLHSHRCTSHARADRVRADTWSSSGASVSLAWTEMLACSSEQSAGRVREVVLLGLFPRASSHLGRCALASVESRRYGRGCDEREGAASGGPRGRVAGA